MLAYFDFWLTENIGKNQENGMDFERSRAQFDIII
jgi:hypothetical protein